MSSSILGENPFLLAYGTFASDGDTVWHLLAEFGDCELLQALVNFCKIHAQTKKKNRRNRNQRGLSEGETRGPTDGDNRLARLVNVGNVLKQTPLMFAAYHGRDDVVVFLLKQVGVQCLCQG